VSEEAAVEMQQAHEADLAAKEEALSELRGENQLLKTTLESLERASASSGGSALQEIASNGNSEVSAAVPFLLASVLPVDLAISTACWMDRGVAEMIECDCRLRSEK